MTARGAEIRTNLIALVNVFEDLCVGVENGVYDENVTREYMPKLLIDTREFIAPYVNHRRNAPHNRTKFGANLEKVAIRWKMEE